MLILVTLLLPIVMVTAISQVTNMTDFWQHQLNTSHPLDFQAFVGYEPLDWYFSDAHVFYTYWGAQAKQDYIDCRDMNSTDVPLIIFLQGGPGASSQFSAFNYIGPLKVVDKGSSMHIERNHLGWNGLGNLLVVDQPLNVGFSYDSSNHITQTTEEAALHFTNFMYNFLKTWNCSDKDVYITGESFAGHYVPVFSQFLLSNRTLGIKLKGISIGGPYIDSYIQDNYFDSFLTSFGIVDEYTAEMLQYYTVKSMMNIKHGLYAEAATQMNRISDDQNFFNEHYNGMNIFNARQYDQGNTNYDYDDYLIKIKSQMKIVPDHLQFIDTNEVIYKAFSADLAESKESALLYCISRIKVMLYVGQNDACVSSPGVQTFLNSWNWSMKDNWKRAKKEILKIGDRVYGWRKQYSRLTFALVNNAGHFVPADQPIGFYSMFSEWLLV